jgi:phosphoribosylanthranilate isomerase
MSGFPAEPSELGALSPIVKVKICGITNQSDGEAAVALGADALGFNLWPRSKRFINLEAESEWILGLPPSVLKVAVLVNPSIEEAEFVFSLPYIDRVQFHGEEDACFCARFAGTPRSYIKAVALRDSASCDQIERYQTPYILLDAYAPGEYGGTGKIIDWDLASEFVKAHRELKVFLSGGLNPENVAEAVRKVKPYGVDIASGVEEAPGKKDRGLMKALIAAAKGV